ncbi:hypothetical protein BCR42DRAFT_389922 [Absidia repens]|uniref:Uncharacterized protein n=1 Tax=Absidia repens TaxID=90262 RepID=A0A1X2IR51_9FUNG|nr:hypothetical protein BCR42DRAFT_389922 [Absidia repens]
MKRELLLSLLLLYLLVMQVTGYDYRRNNYDDAPNYPVVTLRPKNDTNADEYDRGYNSGYSAGKVAAEHTYMVDKYTTTSDPDCTTTNVVEDPVTSTTTTIPIATTTIDIPYAYFTTTLPEGLVTITIPIRTTVLTIPVATTTITRRYITV